ncbi:MAG: ribose-phosphate diphosphokinase, partial [Sphingobacteriales bacterium]
MADLMVFSGNANIALAQKVVEKLGIPLGDATSSQFSDGEISIEINENVRGRDVFVMQSTCVPTNDNLMELLFMVDALRRASAGRITAVLPYFGYARQDRRVRSARVPISAKVVADMMATAGVDRVLTVDLHAEQIQGFFDVPVDNVYEFDASRQTTRISANVSGLFGTAAVRLNDNLLRRTSEAEVRAVMGHELGHYAMNHIGKTLVMLTLLLLVGFYIVQAAMAWLLARLSS